MVVSSSYSPLSGNIADSEQNIHLAQLFNFPEPPQATHDKLTQALVNARPKILHSLVVELDGALPFMLAGAWSPFTDFYGNALQDGYEDELLEEIFLSTFAGNGKDYLCISWINIKGAPGKVIADQICDLENEKLPEAFMQFALKHIENVFFDPGWFEALGPDQRKKLDILAASGMDFLGSPPSAPICLSANFSLPCVMSTFYVG